MLNPHVRPNEGPSRVFFAVGALIMIAGFIVAGWMVFKEVSRVATWLTRVALPGSGELNLSEPGKYTVYYEHTTVLDGKPYSSIRSDPALLTYKLVRKETGAEVALTAPHSNEHYDLNTRSGQALMVFTIGEAGAYELSGHYPEGQAGPKIVLAVGKGIMKRLAMVVLPVLGLFVGSLLVGVGIIVLTANRRRRAPQLGDPYQQQTMYPRV